MRVWRIVLSLHASSAFSGEGASRYGGRFNSPGLPAVYTSGSLSLAMLELIVQAGARRRLTDFVYLTADFDPHLVERLDDPFPKGWDDRPHIAIGQAIGDRWLGEDRSAVLRVPSVVAPGEFNYIINPRHTDFNTIRVGPAVPVPFDARLSTPS